MHGIRKVPRLLIVSFVVTCCGVRAWADDPGRGRPEAAGLSAEGLKKLDEAFAKVTDDKQLAGVVVLIARKGKIGHLQTYGMADIEAKMPMKADAIFRIASMTKPVTSVAAMILVDDGKLALDDPVSKYIREFKDQKVLVPGKSEKDDDFSLVNADREVTIRDLLTHTSGLIYAFPGVKSPLASLYAKAKINFGIGETTEKLADNIKRVGGLPLAHQPGKAFTYGLSTDVLGRVVEVVSGKELDEFFRERIFKPLGMTDTSFKPAVDQIDRVAVMYKPDKEMKLVRVGKGDFTVEGSDTYFSGGAGLFSTAGDYFRFCQMLLNGGEYNGVRVLKAETVTQMSQNQIGKLSMFTAAHGDGFGYGFGVVVPGSKNDAMGTGSYSWAGAFYTFFWVDPHKELIGVMMTQIGMGHQLKLWQDFPKLTYAALKD